MAKCPRSKSAQVWAGRGSGLGALAAAASYRMKSVEFERQLDESTRGAAVRVYRVDITPPKGYQNTVEEFVLERMAELPMEMVDSDDRIWERFNTDLLTGRVFYRPKVAKAAPVVRRERVVPAQRVVVETAHKPSLTQPAQPAITVPQAAERAPVLTVAPLQPASEAVRKATLPTAAFIPARTDLVPVVPPRQPSIARLKAKAEKKARAPEEVAAAQQRLLEATQAKVTRARAPDGAWTENEHEVSRAELERSMVSQSAGSDFVERIYPVARLTQFKDPAVRAQRAIEAAAWVMPASFRDDATGLVFVTHELRSMPLRAGEEPVPVLVYRAKKLPVTRTYKVPEPDAAERAANELEVTKGLRAESLMHFQPPLGQPWAGSSIVTFNPEALARGLVTWSETVKGKLITHTFTKLQLQQWPRKPELRLTGVLSGSYVSGTVHIDDVRANPATFDAKLKQPGRPDRTVSLQVKFAAAQGLSAWVSKLANEGLGGLAETRVRNVSGQLIFHDVLVHGRRQDGARNSGMFYAKTLRLQPIKWYDGKVQLNVNMQVASLHGPYTWPLKDIVVTQMRRVPTGIRFTAHPEVGMTGFDPLTSYVFEVKESAELSVWLDQQREKGRVMHDLSS